MPIYEYDCEECGHRFEELHSIEDRHNAVCPICKKAVRLRMSVPRPPIMAQLFTTYGHDGSIIGQRQTTEYTEYPARKKSGKVVNA